MTAQPAASPARTEWRPLAPFIAILGLAEYAHAGLLFVVLPHYVTTRFHAGMASAGGIVGVYYLAEFILKVPTGWLADRLGRRRLILAAVAVSALGYALAATATTLAGVTVGVFLHGFGASPLWPSTTAATADRTPEDRRGHALGVVFALWLVSLGLGYGSLNLLVPRGPRVAFGVIGVAWLVATVVALVAPEVRLTAHADSAATPFEALRALKRNLRPLRLILFGMFIQTMNVGLTMPCFREYAMAELKLGEWGVTKLLLLGGGFTVLLLIPFGHIGDRQGPRRLLLTGLVVSAAALVMLPLFRSLWLVAGAVSLLGVGYALVVPAWNNIVIRHIAEHERALMLSAFMAMELVGMSVGAPLGGALWDNWGRAAPFLFSGTALGLLALLYWFRLDVPPVEREGS